MGNRPLTPKARARAHLEMATGVVFFALLLLVFFFFTKWVIAAISVLAASAWLGIRLRLWRFAVANRSRTFLFVTRRHGWNEFVTNNVAPVLPEGWEVVWHSRARHDDETARHELERVMHWRLRRLKRPLAIRTTRFGLQARELGPQLDPLKRNAGNKRNEDIRSEARAVLETVF